jgi:hypothetical protein
VTFTFTDDQAERFVAAHERLADYFEGIHLVVGNLYPMVKHAFEEDFGPLPSQSDTEEQKDVSADLGGINWMGTTITMVDPHACGSRQVRQTTNSQVRCTGCGAVVAML